MTLRCVRVQCGSVGGVYCVFMVTSNMCIASALTVCEAYVHIRTYVSMIRLIGNTSFCDEALRG